MLRVGFNQLIAESDFEPGESPDGKNRYTLTIEGTERLLITYANCCHPIPGDRIIGVTTSGKGLVVHQSNCKNSKGIMRHPDNYFHLNWSASTRGKFQVVINVEATNKPGVLATVSNIIAEHNSNINSLTVEQKHSNISSMSFTIEVNDRKHLADIMRQLHTEQGVIKISRG